MATLQGSTIVFATSVWVGEITGFSGHEATRDSVDDTAITDTSVQSIPSLIVDYGSFTIDTIFDQSAAVEMPIDTIAETITITYPLKSGEVTAATIAGSGFVTSIKYPDGETKPSNSARGAMTVKWATKPTHTQGSA